ncbi:MAG TPA: ABC transporter transmembrane domain-containing protein [Tepidisphaeraceae bacterium]|jgi:ABC-type multidrug transport system fused ATPase/permease subunit
MSSDVLPKNKKHDDFWRACKFLWPHRKIVFISVFCAFFVGAAFTGGLGTMLPILRVLIDGDTVPNWVNRQIVEKRLDIKLAEDPNRLMVVKVHHDGPAAAAGLRAGDEIRAAALDAGDQPTTSSLALLGDPNRSGTAEIQVTGKPPLRVQLPPLPRQYAVGWRIAQKIPTDPVWAIGVILIFIVLLACIGNVFRFFQEYLSDKAAIITVNDIRRKLYDHVLHVPLDFFGMKGSSDVTSRLVQDSQGLENGFKTVLGQAIQEPIKAAMAFGLALFISWKLTLFIVLFAPLMVVIIRKFGKKMRRASRKALQNSSSMLGQIEGTLIGIRVVKSAGAERFERRRYTKIMDRLVDEQLHMSRIDAFSTPTMETLTLLVVGGVLIFATYLVLKAPEPRLSVKDFFLVMACLMGIGESLRRVGKLNNVLNKASAAAARIFETLDVPVERRRDLSRTTNGLPHAGVREEEETVKLPPLQREIRFENITFSYANSTAPALSDVSLTVPKGQSVAIVGRNGSGKTTLLALLPRFYDPKVGRILIDGIDIRRATLRSLRGQIGIVTQDSVIFPGTVAENIAYGIPNADRDAVIAAARRAFAHDFILEKPRQYDTILGEMGGQLSGGQKQRICIARAIFRASPILILDEATSQVDAESEHLIQQAIESLMHERTTFVIAHRFSTILSADTIVVMERGRIVGQGQHDELLRNCETYQQLYERQLIAPPGA